MLKMVLLQLGATLVATVVSGLLFGTNGAWSALMAGAACVVPNALFAWRLSVASVRSGGAPGALGFFVGEGIKVATIVGLLVLIHALYKDLHWGALFIGMILALKANLFAFLVKT